MNPLPAHPYRRRNWTAICLATLVMVVSYAAYAAAFSGTPDEPDSFDSSLFGLALATAPFVFIVLAFVSRNVAAPFSVIKAMALIFPVGLSFGLLSPVLGATAAFGFGGTLTLRRLSTPGILKWRLWSVVFTVIYTLVLLVVLPPAGVFTGGLMPLVMLGFADEYALWSDLEADARARDRAGLSTGRSVDSE